MKFLRPECVLSELFPLQFTESTDSDHQPGSESPGSDEYARNHIHMTAMAA